MVYVLSRGGRFEDHEKGYKGERVAHPYAALFNLYQEKTATTIHAGTGRPHPGVARYVPVRGFNGEEVAPYRAGHDLVLITHRVISQTKSRTIASPWLSAILPENGILIHPHDAERLGLVHGQNVKVTSATNTAGQWPLGNGKEKPMIGKLVVTQTVRPGVVSFALGFGHWATGAEDVVIDGDVVRGEVRRTRGIHANAAMWTDPTITNTCLFDPVGGSVSFYDTHVRLEPVTG